MKSLICILIGLLFLKASAAEVLSEQKINKIVNSIYVIEGSKKFPYGIKSINTHGDKELARKYCFNTVKNTFRRWEKAGRPGKFFEFLSNRYCPVSDPADKSGLNKNWLKNLKKVSGLDI